MVLLYKRFDFVEEKFIVLCAVENYDGTRDDVWLDETKNEVMNASQ